MVFVNCRHAHFDWQSTEAFVYVMGKSNITLPWTYIIVLDIKEKHNSTFLLYTHYRNTYQQGSKLLQTKTFKNRELKSIYLWQTLYKI